MKFDWLNSRGKKSIPQKNLISSINMVAWDKENCEPITTEERIAQGLKPREKNLISSVDMVVWDKEHPYIPPSERGQVKRLTKRK